MNRTLRRAFTLVELLVVIAIIGVLVSMLLPAIMAAREAANRASCMNNLTQLIIGVHNYEMAHGVYPPGTIAAKGPIIDQPNGLHHSWLVQILPYLEQQNTYNNVDFKVPVYHKNNRPVRRLSPELFHCPSSPSPIGGYTTYAGVHHDVEAPIDVDNNGVFFLNSRIRYEDITDGSSHTLFIGEKYVDNRDLGWMSGTRSTLRNTGAFLGSGKTPRGAIAPRQLFNEFDFLDDGLEEGDPGNSGAVVAPAGTTVGGFDSAHPAGSMFAFGDGRVEFISRSTSLTVLQQLAHRADGKLLDEWNY